MSGDSRENLICWDCKKKLTPEDLDHDFTYIWGRRWCSECYKKHIAEDEEERQIYIRLKKKEMYKKALHILEMQNINMYDFQEAAEVVKEYQENNPDKFDSSYEVLTAIILVKNRIYSKAQYKIGRYQVDFLLPDIGVVLEIDGERHRHKKLYDNNRDIDIRNALGPGWDIIRLKTTYLDKQAVKIPEAINAVIEYRENLPANKWRTQKEG